MSRLTTFYAATIAAFIAGLWAVVRLGQSLHAPHDLSGHWTVVEAAGATPARTLAVAQSGRFVKLKVDGQKPVELVLTAQPEAGPASTLVFEGDRQRLTVHPAAATVDRADGTYRFELQGPINAAWSAKREASAVAGSASATH